MRHWFLFILVLLSGSVSAETYRCTTAGKTVYSDLPCSGQGGRVVIGSESVPQSAEIDALRRAMSDKEQLRRIEQEKATDEARFRAQAEKVASEDRRAAQEKAARCNAAQADKTYNDRRVARYQDWGWQNSQNQARAERDAVDRRVRDNCD